MGEPDINQLIAAAGGDVTAKAEELKAVVTGPDVQAAPALQAVASDPNPSPDPVKAAPLSPDAQAGDSAAASSTAKTAVKPVRKRSAAKSPAGKMSKKAPVLSGSVSPATVAPVGPATTDPNVPSSLDAVREAKERAILEASTPEAFRDAVTALDEELGNGLKAKQWAQAMFLAFSTNTANKDTIRTYAQGLPEEHFIRAKWEALATAQLEAKKKSVEGVEPKEGRSDASELLKEKIEKLEGELDELRTAYVKKDYEETGIWKRLRGIFPGTKNIDSNKAEAEKLKYREKLRELFDVRLEVVKSSGKEGGELKKAMATELEYFGTESKVKLYDAWKNVEMEKKGITETILSYGRKYNKLPFWKKAAIGVGAFAAGGAMIGTLGTVGLVATTAMSGVRRGMAAGGLFATIEATLEKGSEKYARSGVGHDAYVQLEAALSKETSEEKMESFENFLKKQIESGDQDMASRIKGRDRRRVAALGTSLLVTWGLVEAWQHFHGAEGAPQPEAKPVVNADAVSNKPVDMAGTGGSGVVRPDVPGIAPDIPPVGQTPVPSVYDQPSPGHSDAPTDNYKEALRMQDAAKVLRDMPADYAIEKGDTTWHILDSYLTDHDGNFAGMTEGQQTHAIDALKDKLKLLSPAQLKEAGFSSGNIDKLRIGDTIHLDRLIGTVDADNAIVNATKISAEAVKSIEANNARIAEWTAAHPGVPINDVVIENQILHPNAGVASDVAHASRVQLPPQGFNGAPADYHVPDTGSSTSVMGASAEGVRPPVSPAEASFERPSLVEMRRGGDWFMQVFRVDDQGIGAGKDWVIDRREILGTKMSDILKVDGSGKVIISPDSHLSPVQSENLRQFTSELPKVLPDGRAALADFYRVRPNISVGEYLARVAKYVPQGTRIGLYTTTN